MSSTGRGRSTLSAQVAVPKTRLFTNATQRALLEHWFFGKSDHAVAKVWNGSQWIPIAESTELDAKRDLVATGLFRAHRSGTAQAIAADAYVPIQLNTENFDLSGWFDNATNYRYTPQLAGYYHFAGQVQAGATPGAGNTMYVALRKNGGVAAFWEIIQGVIAGRNYGHGSDVLVANGSTDYFDLAVFIETYASMTIVASPTSTFLTGRFIGT